MEDNNDDLPWHIGVFDAHCHPTDTLSSLDSMPGMRAKVLTIMATRAQDQQLVAEAAEKYGVHEQDVGADDLGWRKDQKVVPAFGWHPWFSHQMFDEADYEGSNTLSVDQKVAHYQNVLNPKSEDLEFLRSLPDPHPFGHFLGQTREYLERFPLALVGEVGLDRSFRIPEAWLPEQADSRDDALTPGGREGRKLSPYRVSIEHQKKVLGAQLRLAGEMGRAVSIHGVQAHGVVYETLASTWKGHEIRIPSKKERKKKDADSAANLEQQSDSTVAPSSDSKPYPPRVCLHSFSGPAETVKQYNAATVPCEVFFSFSTTINSWSDSSDGKVEATVKAVPPDRLLVESDLHTAGEDMDRYLEDAVRRVCSVRQWTLEEGVAQLGRNWRRFVFGARQEPFVHTKQKRTPRRS